MVKIANDPWGGELYGRNFPNKPFKVFLGFSLLCIGGLISNFYISVSRFSERDKVVLVVFIIHPKISLTTAQSLSPAASLFRLMESFSSHITVW